MKQIKQIKLFFKSTINYLTNPATILKILIIFSFGLLSRMFINNVFEINVFTDYNSFISIIYYLSFSCFIAIVNFTFQYFDIHLLIHTFKDYFAECFNFPSINSFVKLFYRLFDDIISISKLLGDKSHLYMGKTDYFFNKVSTSHLRENSYAKNSHSTNPSNNSHSHSTNPSNIKPSGAYVSTTGHQIIPEEVASKHKLVSKSKVSNLRNRNISDSTKHSNTNLNTPKENINNTPTENIRYNNSTNTNNMSQNTPIKKKNFNIFSYK